MRWIHLNFSWVFIAAWPSFSLFLVDSLLYPAPLLVEIFTILLKEPSQLSFSTLSRWLILPKKKTNMHSVFVF